MKKLPRTDGLYVHSGDRRSLLRFSDGAVITGVVSYDEPLQKRALTQLEPKVPTKGNSRGPVPAPIAFTGDRIRWTTQLGWDQADYEATWEDDRLVVDVMESSVGRGPSKVTRAYTFISMKAVAAERVAPPFHDVAALESPSATPPKDATKADGMYWRRLASGSGATLGPDDIVTHRITNWEGATPTIDRGASLVCDLPILDLHHGDVVRMWSGSKGRFEVSDLEVLDTVDKHPQLRRDGMFLGPEVDGRHLAVRFIDNATLWPLRVGAAYVEATKLKRVLDWFNVGTVKDLFLLPAPIVVDGDRIRWTSQVSMDEQIAFAGEWANERLVLDLDHHGPAVKVRSSKRVHFDFVSPEDVATRKTPSKKSALKRRSE